MTNTTTRPVTTTCSGCAEQVRVDGDQGTATVRVASNGRRGSLHIAAHTVTADVYNDGDLLTWDCPACDHADSWDLHQ